MYTLHFNIYLLYIPPVHQIAQHWSEERVFGPVQECLCVGKVNPWPGWISFSAHLGRICCSDLTSLHPPSPSSRQPLSIYLTWLQSKKKWGLNEEAVRDCTIHPWHPTSGGCHCWQLPYRLTEWWASGAEVLRSSTVSASLLLDLWMKTPHHKEQDPPSPPPPSPLQTQQCVQNEYGCI